jgi:hypothetical protein
MSNPLSGAPSSGVNPAFTQTSSTAGAQKSTTKPSSVGDVAKTTLLEQIQLSQEAIKKSEAKIKKYESEGRYETTRVGGEHNQEWVEDRENIEKEEHNRNLHADQVNVLNRQLEDLESEER